MTCLKCSSQHAGQILRLLKDRMSVHIRSINKFGQPGLKPMPVSLNFDHNCHRSAKYNFQILETIKCDTFMESTTTYRHLKERWWVITLRMLNLLDKNISV